MKHEKEGWAIFIALAIGVGFLVYVAAHAVGQVLALRDAQSTNSPSALAADTSGWQTYTSSDFGFSLHYPTDWQLATNGLVGLPPFIAIGNPLSGVTTYVAQVFIENNTSSLSSGEYVHQLLAADHAEDGANAAKGPAPRVTPQYTGTSVLEVGMPNQSGRSPYEAYELSGVFEFDHNADQVYVADGKYILRFDFPVAQENPNISLPVANNAVVQEILHTLMLH